MVSKKEKNEGLIAPDLEFEKSHKLNPYAEKTDSPVDEEIRFDVLLYKRMDDVARAIVLGDSKFLGNCVRALEFQLNPYIETKQKDDFTALRDSFEWKLRRIHPDKRQASEERLMYDFYFEKANLLMSVAKSKGFFPKHLVWE